MNQSINTDSKNSKEPQQKYRLGTVSIKILGGLNLFSVSKFTCSPKKESEKLKNSHFGKKFVPFEGLKLRSPSELLRFSSFLILAKY